MQPPRYPLQTHRRFPAQPLRQPRFDFIAFAYPWQILFSPARAAERPGGGGVFASAFSLQGGHARKTIRKARRLKGKNQPSRALILD
jgi:hypothetical protein